MIQRLFTSSTSFLPLRSLELPSTGSESDLPLQKRLVIYFFTLPLTLEQRCYLEMLGIWENFLKGLVPATQSDGPHKQVENRLNRAVMFKDI
jgi:hypothetical protein